MLDDIAKIKQLDSQNMLGSLQSIGQQVEQIAAEVDRLLVPEDYKQAQGIVVAGMGGSTLGAHIIKTLFAAELRVPVEIVNYYTLPAFVSAKTLVVISSYSGTTEEAIAAFKDARRRQAKILIVTSGGELKKTAEEFQIPALVFSTENNPCGSPRMGLGYTAIGPILLLQKMGFLTLPPQAAEKIIDVLAHAEQNWGAASPAVANTAKQFSEKLLGRSVWYIGAEHLVGSVHVAANQMNENAKRFAGYFVIPELNHHLLEGLQFPTNNKERLSFVLVESSFYNQHIQKRFAVTKEILTKNEIPFVSYMCQEKTPFEQVAEMLVLSSYLSYYSALLEGIDPTAIPIVDYFKAALRQQAKSE